MSYSLNLGLLTLKLPKFSISVTSRLFNFNIGDKIIYGAAALTLLMFTKRLFNFESAMIKSLLPEKTHITRNDGPNDKLVHCAVVVGANTPIGRLFAQELASRNFAVVLIGDNSEEINQLASEIMNKQGVSAIPFVTDAYSTRNYPQFIRDLETNLNSFPIRILVNANQVAHDSTKFHQMPLEEFTRNFIYGIEIPTLVMQKCLSIMQEHSGEYESAVLNITSGRCVGPSRRDNKFVYGASKAFLDYMSRGAALDYEAKGIHVHTVRQFNFKSITEEQLKQFVKNTLAKVGKSRVIHGSFSNYMKNCFYPWVAA